MKNKLVALLALNWIATGIGTPAQISWNSFPSGSPEENGISSRALEHLASVANSWFERDTTVGGSLLVIKNRRAVCDETCGWRDRESQIPMDSQTLFNIRSMTKMLTGAACQILVDEGKLTLNDPVAFYLPGFDTARSRDITVEQLLTHRSGLPLTILSSLDEYSTLYAMANAVGRRGPQFTPGSRFWYSDAGSDCLGAVVEVASGTNLDAFVRARLLVPLGMSNTYYLHEAATPRERIASLYMGEVGAWTNIWTPDQPFYPFAWGAQSLYSTPDDFARFLAMLLDKGTAHGERILSEAAVARILTPVSMMTSLGSTAPFPSGFADAACQYGQMAVLYKTDEGVQCFGHSGSDGTWAWAWPDQDLIICYFTQSRGQATGIRLETEFDRWLLQVEAHPDNEIAERYAPRLGWYRADFKSALGNFRNQEFAVVVHRGRLGIDIPGNIIFELNEPTSAGRWYFRMDSQLSISFDSDTNGMVTGMRFFEPGRTCRLPRIQKLPAQAGRFVGFQWLHAPSGTAPAFRFWLEGMPTFWHRIEYSADMASWESLQTSLLGGCRLEIIDRDAGNAAVRFYRSQVAVSGF